MNKPNNITIKYVEDTLHRTIDTAADDQQQQIDALEQLLLKRAALIAIEQDGRKIRFTFTRRGIITRVECYGDMSLDVKRLRRELLE